MWTHFCFQAHTWYHPTIRFSLNVFQRIRPSCWQHLSVMPYILFSLLHTIYIYINTACLSMYHSRILRCLICLQLFCADCIAGCFVCLFVCLDDTCTRLGASPTLCSGLFQVSVSESLLWVWVKANFWYFIIILLVHYLVLISTVC